MLVSQQIVTDNILALHKYLLFSAQPIVMEVHAESKLVVIVAATLLQQVLRCYKKYQTSPCKELLKSTIRTLHLLKRKQIKQLFNI